MTARTESLRVSPSKEEAYENDAGHAFRIQYPLAEDGVIRVLRVLAEHAGDVGRPFLEVDEPFPREQPQPGQDGLPHGFRGVGVHVRAAAPEGVVAVFRQFAVFHCGPPVVPPLSPGCVWLLRLMFEAVTSPVALSDPASVAVVAPPPCDCMESSPLMTICGASQRDGAAALLTVTDEGPTAVTAPLRA